MGLEDPYRLLQLPGSTHLLRDRLERGTEFSAPRLPRWEGQSLCSGSLPSCGPRVRSITFMPRPLHRTSASEGPAARPQSLLTACSGSAATSSAHRDPGGGRGRAFLPLRPGLGAAPGWSLNYSVHLLPTQSTDSAHYLNRHTNLQNLSQLLRSIKRSIKAAFAKEELPRR